MELNGIKVVTICGSMKWADMMVKTALDLEKKYGWCVLQCVYDFDNAPITPEELEKIKIAHYKRIEISDAIYVLNIGGYIGKSVTDEINFAQQHNIQVIYHEQI